MECVVDALFQNEKESPDDEVESGFTYGEIRATVIELMEQVYTTFSGGKNMLGYHR